MFVVCRLRVARDKQKGAFKCIIFFSNGTVIAWGHLCRLELLAYFLIYIFDREVVGVVERIKYMTIILWLVGSKILNYIRYFSKRGLMLADDVKTSIWLYN